MWPMPKRSPPPEITNEAYARWLRACRPPFAWFAGLSVEVQEQLALLGDEHRQDAALAIAYAVRDPELAEAGIGAAAGDAGAEETLARRVAAGLVQRIVGRQDPQAPPRSPISETAPPDPRTIFGRPPDQGGIQ